MFSRCNARVVAVVGNYAEKHLVGRAAEPLRVLRFTFFHNIPDACSRVWGDTWVTAAPCG